MMLSWAFLVYMKLIKTKCMKKWLIGSMIATIVTVFVACEALDNAGLSEAEIVEGLKTALTVGTDSSVTQTSADNGYLMDETIKILLPDEAKVITDNIQYVNQFEVLSALGIDLNSMVDDVIKSMNKAAESAAKQAAPIFKDAITGLNISDGLSILNGKNPLSMKKAAADFDSTAATHYLVSSTRDTLVGLYKQPIDGELNKDLGLGFSANNAWSTLSVNYNKIADVAQQAVAADALLPDFLKIYTPEQIGWLKKFTSVQQTTLGTYVTGKALDGLFLKVGEQEKSIRRDPWQWVSDKVGTILQKVFGKA